MHFTGRSAFGTLVFVGGLIALNSGPGRLAAIVPRWRFWN